jgi:hypothetical protein
VPAADICAALDACLCCAHRNQAAARSAGLASAGAALVRHCGQGSLSPCRLPGVDLPCPALPCPAAFNHILGDVSLVVYQFEAIAGFSAVVDRLGEFQEVLTECK